MMVDIGRWVSYEPSHDAEQLQLQRDNLVTLPVWNNYGYIRYIPSRHLLEMEYLLEDVTSYIKVQDTSVILDKEVYYSSKIEGAKTTLRRTQSIHNGAPVKDVNDAMLLGGFRATKLLNIFGGKIGHNILHSVWCELINNCCQNEDIRGDLYRNGEVYIAGSDFDAVPCDKLVDAMSDFIQFYMDSTLEQMPFIKAAIVYYAFETIHPFCDGNGRLGRLLMNNLLIKQGYDACRVVSFSKYIDENRGMYDWALEASENQYCDCTPFIEYMLEWMLKAFYNVNKER